MNDPNTWHGLVESTMPECRPIEPLHVHYFGHYLPLSRQLALDYGIVEPTPEEAEQARLRAAHYNKWHRRLRRYVRGRIERARYRVACWIVGYEFEDRW